MSGTEIDKIDQEILEILGKYGRISYIELAKMVRRSPSAVRRRVEKMLRDKLIERFTIVVNAKKVGRNLVATLQIHPASRRLERVADLVAKMPCVMEAYHMTGECGIPAIVQVGDIEELNECIKEIQGAEGVLDVEACVALNKIKSSEVFA